MIALKSLSIFFLAGSLLLLVRPAAGFAPQNSDAADAAAKTGQEAAPAPTAPDDKSHGGAQDFDPLIGAWKEHTRIRQHPLTGSDTWIEFEGIDVYRKIWDGRAIIAEYEGDSNTRHAEGLMLYTRNPETNQWSIYFAGSGDGKVTAPNAGEFKNGQGEFYTRDTVNGRLRYNRYIWSKLTSNSPRFEESWSADGGKTWEVDNITDLTRISEDAVKPYVPPTAATADPNRATAERDGQHDFDFYFGDWKYHLKRLENPLAGSTKWVDFEGTGHCFKVWNGRANLDEFEADSATGHIEGLTLRTYNPATHQWSLYWANSKDGKVVVPQIGQFKDGRGEFYAQDMLNGKSIFIRFLWTNTATSRPHFEQSFSADGGKTWEANWITDQTRVQDESPKTH
jgi:hypothetical protein